MDTKEFQNKIESLTQKINSLKHELDSVQRERIKLVISKFEAEVRELLKAHNVDEVCLEKLYGFELPNGKNVQLDFYDNYRHNRFDLFRLAIIKRKLKYRCILYFMDSNYDETEYFVDGEEFEWHDIMDLNDLNEYTINPEWFDNIINGLQNCEDVWNTDSVEK